MIATMTLTNPDWTVATMTAEWISDSGETPQVAEAAANLQAAYLINNTSQSLPGWTYSDGTFTGPARVGALETVLCLVTEAADFGNEHLDEIRASA